jgi:hypothetical protein
VSGTRTQVGIAEWSRRTSSARAIELQLAAKLGGWVPRVQTAAGKLLLARHARHHAWHVDLWDGLVPVLHDQPPPPGVTVEPLRDAAALLLGAEEPGAVYDDVFPYLVATYRAWAVEATPIAERPLMRVLDLVLRDLDFDAQEGHDLFTSRGSGRKSGASIT